VRFVATSTGGLGIGLALVKGLVELHGGTVTAECSGEGEGSTYTVRIPRISRILIFTLQGSIQPGASQQPQPVGGPPGKAEHVGSFLVLEPGEEPQLHRGGSLRVVPLQFVEGVAIVGGRFVGDFKLIEVEAFPLAAAFEAMLAASGSVGCFLLEALHGY